MIIDKYTLADKGEVALTLASYVDFAAPVVDTYRELSFYLA